VSVGLCSENWLLVLSNPNPHTGGSPQAPSETPSRYISPPTQTETESLTESNPGACGTGLFILFVVGWVWLLDMFGCCVYFGFIDRGNICCRRSNMGKCVVRVLENSVVKV
jgi:hypothetical protein